MNDTLDKDMLFSSGIKDWKIKSGNEPIRINDWKQFKILVLDNENMDFVWSEVYV